jgi:hypothetical protein
MATKTKKMPNLDNATPGFIVDELGSVREEIKNLVKFEGYYKEALKARLEPGQATVDGETFSALIVDTEQVRLDTARIKEDMDEVWLDEHSKLIEFITIKTARRPQ